MLIEMSSPAFKIGDQVRKPIKFHKGLNVILGKADGTNSIGKSSALLAIDFVFGGSSYLTSDGVKHLGDHTIFFAFEFNGKKQRFARSTKTPDLIHLCDDKNNLTEETWEKAEFLMWLQENYQADFHGISFREAISGFFRIYGKDNLDEKKPLYGIQGDTMERSIKRVICLFDRYQQIEVLNARKDEQREQLSVFRKARNYQFVPALVGGKEQFENNLSQINELRIQLENLENDQVETNSRDDIEKSQAKRQLKREQMELENQLSAFERKMKLLDMSLEYGLYPTEADLNALQEFFPKVDVRKIYEVEGYHRKLARILDNQFEEERLEVSHHIEFLREQIKQIKDQILELGFFGDLSQEFLDSYSDLKGRIDALQRQNDAYLKLTELQAAQKKANDLLKQATTVILAEIEDALNGKMKEYNDSLFEDRRRAPTLKFNEYNSYRFQTPHDTGTGTNYKGLLLYDLAVLELTDLPAIAHDSLLLKNVGDSSVDGIMKIYDRSEKQIFIAFDKHLSYTEDTARIVEANTALELSDNGGELYGPSWNKG